MKISRMLFGSVLTLFVATAVFVGWYGVASSAAQDQAEQSSVGQDANIRIAESEKLKAAASPASEDKKTQTEARGQNIQPIDASDAKLLSPPVPARISKPLESAFTLRFLDNITLSSDRTGLLESIKVQPGDSVKTGDELASFDRNDVEQAELDMKIAEVKYEAAKRLVGLHDGAAVPTIEFDRQNLELKVAQLELQRQKLKLTSLAKRFDSPLAGSVAEVFKRPGERVKQGDPVCRIVNSDRFIVEGNVDMRSETVPPRGQPFRFTLSNQRLPERTIPHKFEGKIDFVSAQLVEKSSSTLTIRGVIENRDDILRAGMQGTLQFIDENGPPTDGPVKPDKKPDEKKANLDELISWARMFGMNVTNIRFRDPAETAKVSEDNLAGLQASDAAEFAKLFEKTRYRGGLELEVDPNGPAGKAGIRDGDILVGLGKWDTATIEDVIFVLHQPDVKPNEPPKFYVLRKVPERVQTDGRVIHYGHLSVDQDYLDKDSWYRWMKSRQVRPSVDRK